MLVPPQAWRGVSREALARTGVEKKQQWRGAGATSIVEREALASWRGPERSGKFGHRSKKPWEPAESLSSRF